MLSPYRDQVNYLTRMLAQKLKSKILQDHDIAIGTAHSFQGDERDIMLLSFCADPSSHRSTVTFMNNDNLFNVAVTRARHRQVIFTGLDARNLPQDHLLAQYLDYASECLEPDKPRGSYLRWHRLRARGGADATPAERLRGLPRLPGRGLRGGCGGAVWRAGAGYRL